MKGLSNLVTLILIIGVVVASSIIFYLWETGFQSKISRQATASKGTILKIEGISLENGTLHVFVRNLGEAKAIVDRVYLVDPVDGEVVLELVPAGSPVVIGGEELREIIAISPMPVSGKYVVKIGSQEGVEVITGTSYYLELKAFGIRINEVEANPPGSDRGYEWIELYNPTPNPIDLAGYEIWDKNPGRKLCTIGVNCVSPSTVIPPNGYLVVGGWSGFLNNRCNSKDGVVLKNSAGEIVDETPLFCDEWNTAESYQRIPDGVGEWSFSLSTEGFSNRIIKLYINEYEANPPGNDLNSEWMEIYNPNDFPVDISYLRLYDANDHYRRIDFNSIVPPHGFFVFEIPGRILTNSGDKAILKSPRANGPVYDETPFLVDRENDNNTWQRSIDGGSEWVFKAATKGSSNG